MRDKTIFFCRLMEQVKRTNKSINAIEKDLGYPRNSLNNYKNGGEPSGSRLVELAEYFYVSPDYLVGKVEKSVIIEYFNITPSDYFRNLKEVQKKELIIAINDWIIDELVMNKI